MAKRRKGENQARGRLSWGRDGQPIGYHPARGVAHRVRSLDEVRRLHDRGDISVADFERAIEVRS